MKEIIMPVQKEFCGECSLALMHFLKNMEGIESVEADEDGVRVRYDETRIKESVVRETVRDSIEKMGYHLR